jgi:hypothetical protein
MSQDVELEKYESWPTDPEARRAWADELFGRHIVASLDGHLLSTASLILGAWRFIQPTEEQRRVNTWLDACSEEDRECVFLLSQEMATQFIISLLADLDGDTGGFLKGDFWEQLRVVVEIHRLEDGQMVYGGEPIEQLWGHHNLHEEYFGWQEQYSRWYKAPLSELREAVERGAGNTDSGTAEQDGEVE